MNDLRRTGWSFLLAFGLLAITFSPLFAQGSREYSLLYRFPTPNLNRPGYAFADLEILSLKPAPVAADEQFDIELTIVNHNYRWNSEPRVIQLRAQILIKAGQKSGRTSLLIPNYVISHNSGLQIDIQKSGGDRWPDVEIYLSQNQLAVKTLFVHEEPIGVWNNIVLSKRSKFQEIQPLKRGGGIDVSNFPTFDKFVANQIGTDPIRALHEIDSGVLPITPDLLPDDWVAISQYENLIISSSIWQNLLQNHPEKKQAVADWVYSGGRLLVYDNKNGLRDADDLRQSLAESFQERTLLSKMPWQEPAGGGIGLNFRLIKSGDPRHSTTGAAATQFGKGSISIATRPINQWNQTDWQLNLPNAMTSIQEGTGFSNFAFNSGFRIPGVGQAPVNSFRFLILIFVALIGPVNYVVLRRMRRLNLLMLTVPVISLLTCGALLLFAVLNDGFRLYGRMESVSHLDQRTGKMISDSRHQYFGALVPRDGYAFDKRSKTLAEANSTSLPFVLSDQGENYRISGSEIRSRTEHQFYIQSIQQSQAGLEFETTSDGGLRVTNHLGGTIRSLAVRDQKNYYYITHLGRGESKILTQSTMAGVHADLGKVCHELRPDEPDEEDEFGMSYYYSIGSGFEFYSTDVIKNLRNRLSNSYFKEPHSYVAVMDDFDSIPTRSSGSDIRKQFHVVLGVWK